MMSALEGTERCKRILGVTRGLMLASYAKELQVKGSVRVARFIAG
jgi:hypothetical protein